MSKGEVTYFGELCSLMANEVDQIDFDKQIKFHDCIDRMPKIVNDSSQMVWNSFENDNYYEC